VDITFTEAIFLTILAVAAAIGGVHLVRRTVSHGRLREHNEITDPMLAVLGTLFAILLGFMLANSMQRFEEARSNAQAEAGVIGDLFRLASSLSPPVKSSIQGNCISYADTVIVVEWPHMKTGQLADAAWNVYGDLWQGCLQYQPQTQSQSNVHQALIASIQKLGECRRARAAELHYGLPQSLWFVLLFGGLTTIGFTFFFGMDDVRLHMLMTGLITAIICLNVYMLAGYDAPFSGDISITPIAFESMKDTMLKVSSGQWR